MGNLEYLHTQTAEPQDLYEQITGNTSLRQQSNLAGKARFEAHRKECQTKSLFEGLADIGAVEGKSVNNFPQLAIGDGSKCTPAVNNSAAINAVLHMAAGKYNLTDPTTLPGWDDMTPEQQKFESKFCTKVDWHVSWFDPTRYAEGVVTALHNGNWIVLNWDPTKQDFVRSYGIVQAKAGTPVEKMTKKQRRWYYQRNKHREINNFLEARDVYGHTWAIVMNFEEDQEEYQRKIGARLEMSLNPDVWDEIIKDAEAAEANAKVGADRPSGNGRRNMHREVPAAKQAFHDELSKLKSPYYVYFNNGRGMVRSTVDFGDAAKKAAYLATVLDTKDYVVFDRYEKVPATK